MILQSNFSDVHKHIQKPMKAVLVASRKVDGSFNLITIEWFMRTSIHPIQYAISIGNTRYTYDCLQDDPYFNIIFPSPEQKELLSLCGKYSGREIDKMTAGNVSYRPGKLQKLPIPDIALAVFECKIVTQVKTGDHTVFVGEVEYCWLNEDKEFFIYK